MKEFAEYEYFGGDPYALVAKIENGFLVTVITGRAARAMRYYAATEEDIPKILITHKAKETMK